MSLEIQVFNENRVKSSEFKIPLKYRQKATNQLATSEIMKQYYKIHFKFFLRLSYFCIGNVFSKRNHAQFGLFLVLDLKGNLVAGLGMILSDFKKA